MRRAARALAPTFRYWMQTEVHVFAFSVAANVLLSFFPFLIVMGSIARRMFSSTIARATMETAVNEFFPDALSDFVSRNLFPSAHIQVISLVLLLFTANGVFEPLEVALNHVWGVRKNRNFLHNQAVSFAMIFACGGLAALSVLLTGFNHLTIASMNLQALKGVGDWVTVALFKLAAVPVTIVVLFLIYYFVPNFRPPRNRVIAAAIIIGLLMEALKYLSKLVWPWMFLKISNEYGVFKYSVTLVFLGFCFSMLALAGAEWAARGHRADIVKPEEVVHA